MASSESGCVYNAALSNFTQQCGGPGLGECLPSGQCLCAVGRYAITNCRLHIFSFHKEMRIAIIWILLIIYLLEILWALREIVCNIREGVSMRKPAQAVKALSLLYLVSRVINVCILYEFVIDGEIRVNAHDIARTVIMQGASASSVTAYIMLVLVWIEMALKVKHLNIAGTASSIQVYRIVIYVILSIFLVSFVGCVFGALVAKNVDGVGTLDAVTILYTIALYSLCATIALVAPAGLFFTARLQLMITDSRSKNGVVLRRNRLAMIGHAGMLLYIASSLALLYSAPRSQSLHVVESGAHSLFDGVRFLFSSFFEVAIVTTFFVAVERYSFWRRPWALTPLPSELRSARSSTTLTYSPSRRSVATASTIVETPPSFQQVEGTEAPPSLASEAEKAAPASR